MSQNVPSFSLFLSLSQSAVWGRDQTNSDGSLNITGVVSGKYTLVAIENGWDVEWWKTKVLKPLLEQGKALEVEPNEKYRVAVNVQ